jgi:AbrB family looped-hinge helix DNA binding protein
MTVHLLGHNRLFVVQLASEDEAIMSTLTVTAKGQITLPKNLLKHLGVRPGEKVAVAKLPGGRIVVSRSPYRQNFGCFRPVEKEGRPVAVD